MTTKGPARKNRKRKKTEGARDRATTLRQSRETRWGGGKTKKRGGTDHKGAKIRGSQTAFKADAADKKSKGERGKSRKKKLEPVRGKSLVKKCERETTRHHFQFRVRRDTEKRGKVGNLPKKKRTRKLKKNGKNHERPLK